MTLRTLAGRAEQRAKRGNGTRRGDGNLVRRMAYGHGPQGPCNLRFDIGLPRVSQQHNQLADAADLCDSRLIWHVAPHDHSPRSVEALCFARLARSDETLNFQANHTEAVKLLLLKLDLVP